MKIIFSVLIFSIIISCQDNTNSEKIFSTIKNPETGKRIELSSKIDSTDINGMPANDLRLLRNEIFARHGYKFKSQDLIDYYSQFDWYKPTKTTDEVENILTEADKQNISLIKTFEEQKTQLSNKWNSDIQNYIDLIPEVQLPLEFICEEGFNTPDIDYKKELIKKYKPEGAIIIGKLYQDVNEAAILYGYPADIFYPIISVIDKKGNELKEIRLFELGKCVNDEGYSAETYGTITKDYTIITKSIIIRWEPSHEELNKDTTIIKNTISIK